MKILTEIKEQLQSGKPPLKAQTEYLINFILNLEAGIDPIIVIENTKIAPIPALHGGYNAVKKLRNL